MDSDCLFLQGVALGRTNVIDWGIVMESYAYPYTSCFG